MYLCRIKNPEQLSKVNPGELGRLLGIDRIPEAGCLRGKIKMINAQGKSDEWNREPERIWKSYQIAVITYRKNVTSVWDDAEFAPCRQRLRYFDQPAQY